MKEKLNIGLQFFAGDASGAMAEAGTAANASDGVVQPSKDTSDNSASVKAGTANASGNTDGQVAPAAQNESGKNVEAGDIDAEFQALIGKGGKYNKLFTSKVDEIMKKRHAASENLKTERDSYAAKVRDYEDSLAPIYSLFGVSDLIGLVEGFKNDSVLWEMLADRRGTTPEALKAQIEQGAEIERLRRENADYKAAQEKAASEAKQQAQYDQWSAQIAELKKKVPDFDMKAEMEGNEYFSRLVSVGIPIDQAYGMTHIDEAINAAKEEGRQEAADTIASRQRRPRENAASGGNTVTVRKNVGAMTKAERDEIVRRVLKGEKIDLVNNF